MTATTQSAGDNSTKVATTAYTDTAISNLINGAPAALDTLNELAAAMNDDAAFSTTVTNSLATKMPLAGGQFTGNITFSGSQTVDGRDLSVDGAKLDGIESGATADQTASEILTLIKTVDGAGSGLNADLLDGISSASFVRSDADDTLNGQYTISDSANEKLVLAGSNDPYIRFQEGTTNKAYIRWHDGGYIHLVNQEDDSELRIRDTLTFSPNAGVANYEVWHEGNDGSGSGLDSDLLDGQHGSYYRDADNINAGTLAANRVATLNQDTTGSSASCTGNAATATKLATARTIAGVSFDGSANISLNNNAITNGAGYITATLTNEQVQDIVGAMVSGNTESGISVTYQDGDGTLDFSVTSQTDENFTTTLKNKLDGIASGATNVTNNNQLTNGAGYITSASDSTKMPLAGGEFTGNVICHDLTPDTNNTRGLGSDSKRWANVYTNDLHLSNKGGANKVDGTWGDWTLQEGEDQIFMINNRNGKKYAISLNEIV